MQPPGQKRHFERFEVAPKRSGVLLVLRFWVELCHKTLYVLIRGMLVPALSFSMQYNVHNYYTHILTSLYVSGTMHANFVIVVSIDVLILESKSFKM